MIPALTIENLSKVYGDGFEALKGISLRVEQGDFFALLGPNGAGKSTTIGIICSLVAKTAGRVCVFDVDIDRDFAAAKKYIGIVPQEFNFNQFEKPLDIVVNQAGYYGMPAELARQRAEQYLRALGLWDKREVQSRMLSGGMKRRLMIARALVHEPRLLILDEPTAGVDIEMRRSMWDFLRKINAEGTTIILTTHYIEEAEAIADRVGVINGGELLLVEDKTALMARMGRKRIRLQLAEPLGAVPAALESYGLDLAEDGCALVYTYDTHAERTGITTLLNDMAAAGLILRDVHTEESSLEDIFVDLVKGDPA